MKKKRYNSIGNGEPCKKCNKPMERREHLEDDDKHLQKAYYFSEWDYCRKCKILQHYEHKKVWNNNHEAIKLKRKLGLFKEMEKQNSFIKSI